MKRAVWAGVCALLLGVTGQALASPYTYAGGTYSQNFEGLTWQKSTNYATDFGFAASGTLGWGVSESSGSAFTSYYYRQSSSTINASYAGAPVVPVGATSVSDKSLARATSGKAVYFGVCLTNGTQARIDDFTIDYTLELWTKPTATVTGSVTEIGTGNYAFALSNLWSGFTAQQSFTTFSFAANTLAGTTQAVALDVHNAGWDPNEQLMVKWTLPSTSYANNYIVAVDDFTLSVPEPSVLLTGGGVVIAALLRRQRSVARA